MVPSPTDKPKVLIVEDSRTMRLTLRALLSPDFECQLAEEGAGALAQALAEPPALILSDVEMQGMDGYELLRRVRAEPSLAGVRVVLLSGHAPRPGVGGADLYLVKPVKPALLIAQLHALLGTSPAQP